MIQMKMIRRIGLFIIALLAIHTNAQVVKHERLLSFEDAQVPSFISSVNSKLDVSNEHYKDGLHCLKWSFEPNGVLSIRKDILFEKKDPTGKDTYLAAFIVAVILLVLLFYIFRMMEKLQKKTTSKN